MRFMLPAAAIALAALVVAGTPALADAISVAIDHSTKLNVPDSAASVIVGNPKVADVVVVNSHTVFVSGRGYGDTDVVVLDREGRTIYLADITVAAAASNIAVYKGSARSDFACAPGCQTTIRSNGGAAGGDSTTGADPKGSQNPASGMGGIAGAAAALAAGPMAPPAQSMPIHSPPPS